MFRLSKITKRYGDQTVVDAIDLELQQGKTYALIGPSGCGKSTLLRLMIGLIRPDSGQVWLDDQQLNDLNLRHARRDFGYVIQSGGLFPHLTARKNASLPADYHKWPKQKIDDRIADLAKLTQLPAELLGRFPAQLSGGQRQRVSLIRALMLDPQILLMDEPLGALDPMIRSQLQTQLREIFQSLGKTVVLVTHDLHEAAYFSDRIILLRDGKIMQQGSIEQLLSRPADPFVTEFIQAQQSHLIDSSVGAGS
jgi:osmoprotectant transport system ATP-binding protein